MLGQRSDDSELVITSDDDHPYSGITMEEWGAASARIMAHLLHTAQLLPQHIDYYIAYTVQIYEFAQKFAWEGIVEFDFLYRERQAEHCFHWASNTSSIASVGLSRI